MTADNFEEAIRLFASVRPFRPYTVELHSGRELRVKHPEAVSFRDSLAYFVCAEDPERTFVFDFASVSVVFEEEEGRP